MQTIKWSQPSGALSILETKGSVVISPDTEAWEDYKRSNPDADLSNTRGLVLYDGGTIHVERFCEHLYIVNENGKTVQTV